jgi:transcription-repair coupling factor (superfamily II helicase)
VEAKPLGVLKIDAGEDSIIFTFKDKPSFDPGKFFRMLQANRYAHARAESVTIRNLQ